MVADVYVEGETISRIGKDLEAPPGTEVIDATGKYVFPGFIDPHVHIHLPFMGTFTKDSHTTGSQAALVGGTTTYIEMMAPSRNEDLMAGYRNWTALAEGNSACDYSFHIRSEERRVGKEWRSEWSQWPSKYKYMESLL